MEITPKQHKIQFADEVKETNFFGTTAEQQHTGTFRLEEEM